MKFSLFRCKCAILDACPQGSAVIKIVWISKMSFYNFLLNIWCFFSNSNNHFFSLHPFRFHNPTWLKIDYDAIQVIAKFVILSSMILVTWVFTSTWNTRNYTWPLSMIVVLMKLNNYQLYLVFLYNKVYIKELKGKVSKIYRGGGLCAVFLGGVDHFKN